LLVGEVLTRVDFVCWLQVLPPPRPLVLPLSPLVLLPLPPPLPLMRPLLHLESVSLGRLLALALACVVALAAASSLRLSALVLALVFSPSELAASPPLAALVLAPPSELLLASPSLISSLAWWCVAPSEVA
jgi:hypothetical protein